MRTVLIVMMVPLPRIKAVVNMMAVAIMSVLVPGSMMILFETVIFVVMMSVGSFVRRVMVILTRRIRVVRV